MKVIAGWWSALPPISEPDAGNSGERMSDGQSRIGPANLNPLNYPVILSNKESFDRALTQFHRGHYFAAHESLEALWLQAGHSEKTFLQGLIQLAVTWHHWQQGNLKGAGGVLRRARQRLEALALMTDSPVKPKLLFELEQAQHLLASSESPMPLRLDRSNLLL